MGKLKYLLIVICGALLLSSCLQSPVHTSTMPDVKTKRTISINGEKFTEIKAGEFITWKCRDYIRGDRTLVEVGHFPDKLYSSAGFILYDGTSKGVFAMYKRDELDHRWNWGTGSSYSFIIRPDGTGLYYDFSTAKNGVKSKADDIYKCSR